MIRLLLFILLSLHAHGSKLSFERSSPLGLPTTITDYYIPGSKVEVIPRKNSDSSLVIRILQTKPAADGFRYDLEVYGLDPGTHKLSDFLRYVDTKSLISHLPATFQITTQHPLETLPKPSELETVPPEKLGGYKKLVIALGILWLVILLLIIFYRKKQIADFTAVAPPPTLHEKLHVLVTNASRGNLTDHERANLERLVLGHWKEKIPALEKLPPARALVQLRAHPEASPLILKLEEWLHAPKTTLSQNDISTLLIPFRK
tara:strand:+ start:201 stop:983 length:783 start_codon:yes stop_codon:yes gene_type:complete